MSAQPDKTLRDRHCKPCEGGTQPVSRSAAEAALQQLAGWQLAVDTKHISREFKFKNFYHTMGFVNAVAFIANTEDHHPDLEAGYNYCRVKFTTHAIGGLSENDFICAAKIDALGV
jgi:4a-hydroxytetrahydrobiopterin dehydratase